MDTPQQPQLRRRPKPPYTYCPTTSPTVSSSSMDTANAQQVMPPLPYKTTIRPVGLQSDTGATPQRLRDLENEWKDRRKKALADISNGNRGDNNQQQYGPRQSSVIDRQSGPSLKLAKNRPSSFTGAGDIRLSQSKFTAAQPNLVRCIGPPTPPDTPSTSITPLKLDQVARDTAPSVNRPLELLKLLAAKYETEVIPNRKTRIRTLLNALPILASPLPTTAGPVPLIRPHRGNITVMCCKPPDIVISFRFMSPCGKMSSTNVTCSTIKVRLCYSRISKEIRLDTSYAKTSHSTKLEERLRTKRIVPLTCNGDVDVVYRTDHTDDWRDEEKEGLKRLWDTKREWGKWQ
ncbi:Hypothetical Protein CGB_F3640W [Cryptococcus gattii WM276]|uniref:Uncharacterized protein n=1 Tax=Cryptococcus gattii serotype B (strain WM276 / ATCC MYA-4071) TaxID=367775 RepID=E6R883_CRYGW|nr:Hypothetical Protein CGB_F3640W [Cryptococcus gattii WM276]ADV22974.1 Hypothetical Protein CGB_F3640W [Cryptococcus gattii WM276]